MQCDASVLRPSAHDAWLGETSLGVVLLYREQMSLQIDVLRKKDIGSLMIQVYGYLGSGA